MSEGFETVKYIIRRVVGWKPVDIFFFNDEFSCPFYSNGLCKAPLRTQTGPRFRPYLFECTHDGNSKRCPHYYAEK